MAMPTLEEFISQMGERPWSLYVKHVDFHHLYVRRGPFYANGTFHTGVVCLANIQAKFPGHGAFTDLVTSLNARGFCVAVECVQNERFCKKLEALGFQRTKESKSPPTYFLSGGDDVRTEDA
jgi:hypothetical protein